MNRPDCIQNTKRNRNFWKINKLRSYHEISSFSALKSLPNVIIYFFRLATHRVLLPIMHYSNIEIEINRQSHQWWLNIYYHINSLKFVWSSKWIAATWSLITCSSWCYRWWIESNYHRCGLNGNADNEVLTRLNIQLNIRPNESEMGCKQMPLICERFPRHRNCAFALKRFIYKNIKHTKHTHNLDCKDNNKPICYVYV